ncbi:hypothetical protein C0213_04645 [Latilactobacillus sakei]|nr:hypothetical protein C0213_04645 [Latilactobacillus sakei]
MGIMAVLAIIPILQLTGKGYSRSTLNKMSAFKLGQLLSISTGKRISDTVDDLIHSAKRRKLAWKAR